MELLSRTQLSVVLALYYFDEKKLDSKFLKQFTDKFNNTYHTDISTQTISYAITLFRNVNPSYNASAVEKENTLYSEIWDYYITNDRVQDLKQIYVDFKSGNLNQLTCLSDEEASDSFNKSFSSFKFSDVIDKIKPLYVHEDVISYDVSIRDFSVSYNALKMAGFLCEYDNNHTSFIRKNSKERYTEGHHLVPLSCQDRFSVNLDVEANIISLCSECHNKIHYGRDFEEVLTKLYNMRYLRLKKCGIDISLEELLELYR